MPGIDTRAPERTDTNRGRLGDPERPFADREASITAYANPDGKNEFDLVARLRVQDDDELPAAEDELEARLHQLMPFASGRIARRPQRRPDWDDDGWLEAAPANSGWPAEFDIRCLAKPAVYRLDRAAVASLGVEGDLMLGWRAGDAIARELA